MAKEFHITDAAGKVVRQGKIPDGAEYPALADGQVLHEGLPEVDHRETVRPDPPSAPVISTAVRDKIVGGFFSLALGTLHRYPSAAQDQANMVQSSVAGGSFWCRPVLEEGEGANRKRPLGEWQLLEHTVEQAQQVLADFVKMRDKARASG